MSVNRVPGTFQRGARHGGSGSIIAIIQLNLGDQRFRFFHLLHLKTIIVKYKIQHKGAVMFN